jgi:hypothetical protein
MAAMTPRLDRITNNRRALMKNLFVLSAVLGQTLLLTSAQAQTLKFECNMMSTDVNGHYIKGRSKTGELSDLEWTAFGFETYREPLDASQYIVKLTNNTCSVENFKNCSSITIDVKPSAYFETLSESISIFPQRDTFKTFKGHVATFDVYDQEYHPMTSAVATYESTIKMSGMSDTTVKAKLVCIFKR